MLEFSAGSQRLTYFHGMLSGVLQRRGGVHSQKKVNLSSWAKLQRAGALRGFFDQGLGALRGLGVIGFRGSGFSLRLGFKGL